MRARSFALHRNCCAVLLVALGLALTSSGCAREQEIQIGVPAARDFESSAPLMIADVQIGATGKTGLGPDNQPMVVALIRAEYKDRITRNTEFVIRRKNLGLGARYIEVIPGDGAPVAAGHHFVARSGSLSAEAQAWWNTMLERTRDPELEARMVRLRDRFDDMVAASRENWERERPALEAEARQILDQLGTESADTAADFRRWLDAQWSAGDRRPPE